MPPRRTIDAEMTPRERECFVELGKWLSREEKAPSVRHAAVQMGVSKSRAHELLLLFERKGLIARVRKKPEVTGLTHKGKRTLAETANEEPAITEQVK